jgi:hypothetical protein
MNALGRLSTLRMYRIQETKERRRRNHRPNGPRKISAEVIYAQNRPQVSTPEAPEERSKSRPEFVAWR